MVSFKTASRSEGVSERSETVLNIPLEGSQYGKRAMNVIHTEYQLVDQWKIGQGKGNSVSKHLLQDKELQRRHQISLTAGWERRKRVIGQFEAARS